MFLGKLNVTPPPHLKGQGAMCENGVKNLEHPVADWAGPDNRLALAATFGVKFPGSQNSKVTQVLQRKTFTPGRPKVFLKPAVLVLHMLVDVDV